MSDTKLGPLIYSFFEDQLKCQRGLRPASIRSYRDAMRLFLLFVAEDAQCKLIRLSSADLTSERVRHFLNYIEQKRYNIPNTRNQRLAAIRSFFEYMASRDPAMIAEAQKVAAIPFKRMMAPQTLYLEHDEINAIFANMPSSGPLALRDYALLLFLYNTGARVQEVSDLRRAHLELGSHPRVRLHGKGGKWRVCPLWIKTASFLERLLAKRDPLQTDEDPVFISRSGAALTRFGIYKIVRRHTAKISKKGIDGKPRSISPHLFRHTTAVHLLESGVEVNVIRAWLGHVSLETTNLYAEISIRMKAEALENCELPSSISEVFPKKPIWRDDPTLLNWLQSL